MGGLSGLSARRAQTYSRQPQDYFLGGHNFYHKLDIPLIKAMAIADSGDVDVLMRQEDVLTTVVEEYANAGIISLESRLLNANGQNLWNLVVDFSKNSY